MRRGLILRGTSLRMAISMVEWLYISYQLIVKAIFAFSLW
jgi:hypothetical protein